MTDRNDLKTFYFIILCIILLGIFSAVEKVSRKPKVYIVPNQKIEKQTYDYVPQFVIFSFDGAKSIDIWKETRKFANEMTAIGKPLKYTYFINTAYFLTDENKTIYTGPHKNPGTTNIGISDGIEDIRQRIKQINLAKEEGHEIASHTVGHFSGRSWSKEEWTQEFNSFKDILFGLDKIYPNDNLPKLNLTPNDIIGFRAPYLDISPGLYESLHDDHVAYDSSEVSQDNGWPTKDENGMWHFPLGVTRLNPESNSIIAMDYNIYARQTSALNQIHKGTTAWHQMYNDTLYGYENYFNSNYSGNHAPVLIGHHFENWNDNVYWYAMKEFAYEVCGKPQVVCTSFKDVVDYLNNRVDKP